MSLATEFRPSIATPFIPKGIALDMDALPVGEDLIRYLSHHGGISLVWFTLADGQVYRLIIHAYRSELARCRLGDIKTTEVVNVFLRSDGLLCWDETGVVATRAQRAPVVRIGVQYR